MSTNQLAEVELPHQSLDIINTEAVITEDKNKLTKNNYFDNYCKVPWIMDKLLFQTGKCFNS